MNIHFILSSSGQDGSPPHQVKLDIDPRRWEPGTTTFTTKLHIPSNIAEGEYRLALWLPDGYESLRDNPLYAIQFANENMWDESTGYNVLGTINVDKGAGGSYQRGEKFEVIESTSSVERNVTSLSILTVSNFIFAELINNPIVENDADNLSLI